LNELEKIDLIRSRLGVSYARAKEALDTAGGDVVKALIELEDNENSFSGRVQDRSQELVGQLRGLLHKTQEARIKVKQGDKTVVEFPAPVGALGILGVLASSQLAILGALGTVTAMANNYTLEIDRSGHHGEGEEDGGDIAQDPMTGEGQVDYAGPSPGVDDGSANPQASVAAGAIREKAKAVAEGVAGKNGWTSGLGTGIWRRGRKRRKV
jgi:hypothetical protein